ncbi:MAG TPA: hypothetical protein VMB73_34700 [Acetobacteraceae bacterium]|nr:hypothetical protein [Acetobacteraceae bacterium]
MIRLIVGLAAVLALLVPLREARADYHIFSPYEIDLGELEIEHNGDSVFDHRADQIGATSYTLELGTGLTPWWHSEIELGWDRNPGYDQPTLLTQVVTENMFQLTEPGEDFFDTGFYFEYGQSLTRGADAMSNEATFGPAIGKDIGRTTNIVDLFLTRQFGPDQTTRGLDFNYEWQTKWNLWAPLSPAIEAYGDMGVLGHIPRFEQQQLLAGPVAIGLLRLSQLGLGRAGSVEYELGWLFGTTNATAHGTLRWRLEVEVPF